MQVNPTLSQALQVLTGSRPETSSSQTGPVGDNLLKTANGISVQASNVSKQASTAIGNALLGRSDLGGSLSDQDLHQVAKIKAYATGSSWGVERYDSLDEMPSDMRATWERIEVQLKEAAAKLRAE